VILVVWGEGGRWFGGQLSYSLDEFGMEVMVSWFIMDDLLIYGRFVKL
jgi:hypothetical protein